MSDLADRLVEKGMTAHEAVAKGRMFERARDALRLGARDAGALALFVPGRIEVLGKHTDYAGGRSLLCAVERGVCLVARRRSDTVVRASDIALGTTVEALMDASPASVESAGSRSAQAVSPGTMHPVRFPRAAGPTSGLIADPGWRVYVATVARRLARNFPDARRGADIAFGSDLPMAAGMSSSSALVTAVLLALCTVNDLPAGQAWNASISNREDLAEYLGTVENGQDFRALKGDAGVGTFGGSEDHTAMLCCCAGELSQYAFCPVRHERQIPMPAGCVFAIAVSGVVAEKTGTARDAYNRASLAAREVLDVWNRATGRRDVTLRGAVESSADAADRIRAVLAGAAGDAAALRARFDQFVEETFVIIPEAGNRLAAGRVDEITDLVERSQAGAERGLRNQIPETSFLARSARELGALAASAFGAGFGGSVWALVARSCVEEFCARWSARYAAAFPQHVARSQFFATSAGPAAAEFQV